MRNAMKMLFRCLRPRALIRQAHQIKIHILNSSGRFYVDSIGPIMYLAQPAGLRIEALIPMISV
jgi:hypothetical protein